MLFIKLLTTFAALLFCQLLLFLAERMTLVYFLFLAVFKPMVFEDPVDNTVKCRTWGCSCIYGIGWRNVCFELCVLFISWICAVEVNVFLPVCICLQTYNIAMAFWFFYMLWYKVPQLNKANDKNKEREDYQLQYWPSKLLFSIFVSVLKNRGKHLSCCTRVIKSKRNICLVVEGWNV